MNLPLPRLCAAVNFSDERSCPSEKRPATVWIPFVIQDDRSNLPRSLSAPGGRDTDPKRVLLFLRGRWEGASLCHHEIGLDSTAIACSPRRLPQRGDFRGPPLLPRRSSLPLLGRVFRLRGLHRASTGPGPISPAVSLLPVVATL
ncbi:hypothetical protein NDU88_006427 [Pleurodeles waltl]|uniref:Uncharacterized protein n=1 Tax=Pleurodeles waltl TaxID=8319 RepID=A0AAV7LQG8_PLEWA|nr:hypothetical protein NDU88_006427 [Pleurodeles waltl]